MRPEDNGHRSRVGDLPEKGLAAANQNTLGATEGWTLDFSRDFTREELDRLDEEANRSSDPGR